MTNDVLKVLNINKSQSQVNVINISISFSMVVQVRFNDAIIDLQFCELKKFSPVERIGVANGKQFKNK